MHEFNDLDKKVKWLILKDVPGLGPHRLKKLYEDNGDIDNIFRFLLSENLNTKYKQKAKEYLMGSINTDIYLDIIKKAKKFDIELVTLDDNSYPENLKKTSNPPPVLYIKGNIKKIRKRSLAIVGTVSPSDIGVKRAIKFSKLCAENDIQVISGLARGIDTTAHKAALKFGIKTYAVVGHGLNHIYPPENEKLFKAVEKSGAVISQFDIDMGPKKWTFPKRNEVMCTLSSGTVIIEGEDGCGSIVQADFSFKHNRPVFILKNNLEKNNNEWALDLVEKGAIVVEDFDSVLEIMDFKEEVETKTFKNLQLDLNKYNNKLDKKAVIFDLDGVIFDAKDIMLKSYVNVIKNMTDIEPKFMEIESLLTESPYKVFKKYNISGKKGYYRYKKIYKELIISDGRLFDNIIEVLNFFKNKKYYLGIVTSQPRNRLNSVLQNLKIKKYFDSTISWNDVPKGKHKPDPYSINKIVDILNVEKENCFFIGDTHKDIIAANKANVKSVAVTWGFEDTKQLSNNNPDFLINKPLDLINLDN